MEMKKLVVNGVAYTVADPDAAHIDDAAVSEETCWSGRKTAAELRKTEIATVDMLCPAFSQSGAQVSCRPVEGYPLGVVSHIAPVQEGSGDPAPDNIRPFRGYSAVKLYRNGEEFTAALGQTVYGGALDWNSGVLTLVRRLDTLDGSASWRSLDSNGNEESMLYYTVVNTYDPQSYQALLCNYVPDGPAVPANSTYNSIAANHDSPNILYLRLRYDTGITNVEELQAALNAAPLQVCVKIEPITIQLTPKEILALAGENVLSSNTGDTEVSGRVDIRAILERYMTQEVTDA